MSNANIDRSKDEKCKGFWNMCACEKCRAADRALEKKLEDPKQRASAVEECAAAKGVKVK